jgi:hypothetical protein
MTPASTRTPRLGGRALAFAGAVVLGVVLGACSAEAAPSVAPTPTPVPTPGPTATPLPGTPLPEAYRPEGDWNVTFALPGDFIRETWRIVLNCPKGACDATVEIRDGKGKVRGRGELTLQDGRYVLRSTTTATINCRAAGKVIEGGATRRTETDVVLASYRLAGTAITQRSIQGSRTVSIEPQADSGCAPSRLVYPGTGELAAK